MSDELIIDFVRHMKARNRQKWTAEDGLRPLSKLGRRQAEWHATAMLDDGPAVVALYCSPALRCRETIAPLSERLGLDVEIDALLAETDGYRWPLGWDGFDFGPGDARSGNPVGAAHAGGRGLAFVNRLRAAHAEGGRAIACSHGDTIPVTVAALAASAGVTLPPPLWGFGGWYRVRLWGASVSIERFAPPSGFPEG